MKKDKDFYADLHSHFLFGVDDGASNPEQSLAMLKQAEQLHIKYLLATPHVTELMTEDLNTKILENFSRVKDLVVHHTLSLEIFLASELFFNPGIYNWLDYPWATFDNKKKYLLFELPFYKEPEGVGDFIFHCHLKGITPILAHPERYSYLRRDPETLLNWHRQGCLLQMNAGSIAGQFGNKINAFAHRLLQAQMIQFVASDAHDSEYRSYAVIEQARDIAAAFLPAEYSEEIFLSNPRKIFNNSEINVRDVNEKELQSAGNKILSILSGKWQKIKF